MTIGKALKVLANHGLIKTETGRLKGQTIHYSLTNNVDIRDLFDKKNERLWSTMERVINSREAIHPLQDKAVEVWQATRFLIEEMVQLEVEETVRVDMMMRLMKVVSKLMSHALSESPRMTEDYVGTVYEGGKRRTAVLHQMNFEEYLDNLDSKLTRKTRLDNDSTVT